MNLKLPAGVQIDAPIEPGFETILTHDALALVAKLHRAFEPRRAERLAARAERARRLDAGERPDFLASTKHIRDGDWRIAALPKALELPAGRDHRPGRREDGHQCLQLGRRQLHDRLRGQQHADLEQPDPGPDQHRQGDPPHADARPGRQELQAERHASRRCRCVRAAGTSTRSMCRSTASGSRAASSTSRCSCSTTRRNSSRAAPGRTSICRRWRATSRRGCGTTSS